MFRAIVVLVPVGSNRNMGTLEQEHRTKDQLKTANQVVELVIEKETTLAMNILSEKMDENGNAIKALSHDDLINLKTLNWEPTNERIVDALLNFVQLDANEILMELLAFCNAFPDDQEHPHTL
eukprot:TRINITY_DN5033_c0_g1_i7.p2 TRINITY_DN5033_c0_g1~~TRINITY_DN5033_c0_g1_i7.p2  ORF type:complete len:123 (+),score=30.48 TRINITY_DN5033_c0_g1_i7:288-656(+)